MIVVDASLATKWFLMEADSPAAEAFLAEYEAAGVCGPDLLMIEVSRAVVAAVNARRIAESEGHAAIKTWLAAIDAGRIAMYRSNANLIDRAVALALTLGHPLSDCIYLALAMVRDLDLATCDAKFHRKASTVYPQVRLLTEYDGKRAPIT